MCLPDPFDNTLARWYTFELDQVGVVQILRGMPCLDQGLE